MDFSIQSQARSMPTALEGCERRSRKCKGLFNLNTKNSFQNRGGTTRLLSRDGGIEELRGVPNSQATPQYLDQRSKWNK